MIHHADLHHRQSIRLEDYDYSRAGAYFITICTHNRECVFGDMVNGNMRLNEYGHAVETEWIETANIRSNVELDAFVVMPNHFHGILVIIDGCRGTARYAPAVTNRRFGGLPSGSLPAVIRSFKSAATKRINESRGTPGTPVWQRNYYEHVIRNEIDLDEIRKYIIGNPAKWDSDRENPENREHRG